MKYIASLLVLLPLVAAEVARLKLHKIQQVSQDPALETAYPTSKYGVAQPRILLVDAGVSVLPTRMETSYRLGRRPLNRIIPFL